MRIAPFVFLISAAISTNAQTFGSIAEIDRWREKVAADLTYHPYLILTEPSNYPGYWKNDTLIAVSDGNAFLNHTTYFYHGGELCLVEENSFYPPSSMCNGEIVTSSHYFLQGAYVTSLVPIGHPCHPYMTRGLLKTLSEESVVSYLTTARQLRTRELFRAFLDQVPYFTLTDLNPPVGCVWVEQDPLFEFNSNLLLPHTQAQLDSIVFFLQENPTVVIEIGVHADGRFEEADLSRNLCGAQARTMMRYLAEKGIDAGRLTAVGYGATRPIIPNKFITELPDPADREEAYAINRRVEIVIISN